MNLVEIKQLQQRPAIIETATDFSRFPDYYLSLLSRLGPGKLEAEQIAGSNRGHVDWFYQNYLDEDGQIRCRPGVSRLVDSLPHGYFRPVLARLGDRCIGQSDLHGGAGTFQIRFETESEPFVGLFRIFMSNMIETGFWIRLYWYGYPKQRGQALPPRTAFKT